MEKRQPRAKAEQRETVTNKAASSAKKSACSINKKCGGCQNIDIPYADQLGNKQKYMKELLGEFGPVEKIIGMENPKYYRNKVHHVFDRDRKGNILSGIYEADSHRVVDVKECLIEDKLSQQIIETIKGLLKSFKITVYDEDSDYGLLRHVLVRRGFTSGEVMVVLVLTSPILPSKNNFVKALRKVHPEITTVVLNINDRQTSMVLGERNITLYGPGFIKDELCGCRFRISPNSFYQVNPVQTEVLYNKAIEYAGLDACPADAVVIDAYCGIGTIGLVAAKKINDAQDGGTDNQSKRNIKVIGIELNKDAVKDAILNAKENRIGNIDFYQGDAGKFMVQMAEQEKHANVVFMDPPRSGSTEEFIDAVAKLSPDRVVYVSCGPETLARDLKYFKTKGYRVRKIQPVDMFPHTGHVETVCLMTRK